MGRTSIRLESFEILSHNTGAQRGLEQRPCGAAPGGRGAETGGSWVLGLNPRPEAEMRFGSQKETTLDMFEFNSIF